MFPPAPEVVELAPLDEFAEAVDVQPNLIEDFRVGASAAAAGFVDALAVPTDDDGWLLEGPWSDRAADRVALGLLELGVEFERIGPGWNHFQGSASLAELRVAIEADGANASMLDPDARFAARIEAGGLDELENPGALTGAELIQLAQLPVLCPDRLPLVGGNGCAVARTRPGGDGSPAVRSWRVATTGDPTPGSVQVPDAVDGGVSWNNREAQAYRPSQVTFLDASAFELRAEALPAPDVSLLPYASGMVFAETDFSWGELEATVQLPPEPGLWPAIWLLGTEACASPGRCPGFESVAYHEIDLIETRSHRPEELHTSVHWYEDDRADGANPFRSATAVVASAADQEPLTVTLVRRPGLLQWLINGEEVFTVAGPAHADRGPHRLSTFLVIANLAVGGSFAGDQLVGRTGGWWGDARVPAGFPTTGWTSATMTVDRLITRPLPH